MDTLGNALFKDSETKNFDLIVDDSISRKLIHVHKLVLQNSSPFFRDKLGGVYYFFFVWNVPPGYLESATRIINYMYTRDLKDLDLETYSQEIQQLCLILELPTLHFKIRTRELHKQQEKTVLRCISQLKTSMCEKTKHKDIKYQTRSKKQMILRSHR